MQSIIGNILATAAIAVTAILFQIGMVTPGNAFFAVALVLLVYTANQLNARENQPLREAVVNMFTNPASYARRSAFAAYVGTTVVGSLVILETLVYL